MKVNPNEQWLVRYSCWLMISWGVVLTFKLYIFIYIYMTCILVIIIFHEMGNPNYSGYQPLTMPGIPK